MTANTGTTLQRAWNWPEAPTLWAIEVVCLSLAKAWLALAERTAKSSTVWYLN